MCGVILVSIQKYREAKVFLESLTAFHPLFAEGWIILHLFYQQIEYHPGNYNYIYIHYNLFITFFLLEYKKMPSNLNL